MAGYDADHLAAPSAGYLDRIERFIAKDSPRNARRTIARIHKAVATLSTFPESGSLVTEADAPSGAREIYVGWYRVIYVYGQREIKVAGVVHGARDFQNLDWDDIDG